MTRAGCERVSQRGTRPRILASGSFPGSCHGGCHPQARAGALEVHSEPLGSPLESTRSLEIAKATGTGPGLRVETRQARLKRLQLHPAK